MLSNSFKFIGRTTAEAELRKTSAGKSVTSISLAVDRHYGENKKTDFFNMVAWDKTAEYIAQYVHKGNMIICEGYVTNNQYEDKDGKKRTSTEFVITEVKNTTAKADATVDIPKAAEAVTTPENHTNGFDEDLPF